MFRKLFRIALAATSTALFVPYAIAFIVELMYGRPTKSHNRFLKALAPKRVYGVNLEIFSQITNLKFIKLAFLVKNHYNSLGVNRLVKDIEYGRNKNTLDLYKPQSSSDSQPSQNEPLKPVLLFIYGGGWRAGDKKMYAVINTNLVDFLNCILVCPNYSIYPKGFVDDMVQDISDTLQWIHDNVIIYGGDKNRVALIGHSAGGHLAALTVAELCLNYLENKPEYIEQTNFPTIKGNEMMQVQIIPNDSAPIPDNRSNVVINQAKIEVGNNNELPDFNDVTDVSDAIQWRNIPVVEDDEAKQMLESNIGDTITNSMVIVGPDGKSNDQNSSDGNNGMSGDENDKNWMKVNGEKGERLTDVDFNKISISEITSSIVSDAFIVVNPDDNNKSKDSVIIANEYLAKNDGYGEQMSDSPDNVPYNLEQDNNRGKDVKALITPEMMDKSQKLQKTSCEEDKQHGNLLQSIRLVIGLAGAYDIEHIHQCEIDRGIEQYSNVLCAMYDESQYRNFSPTFVIKNLPEKVRLPPFHLYHGSLDEKVPIKSTLDLGAVLWERNERTVQIKVLKDCDHTDIMLDLISKDRRWFNVLMNEFKKGFDLYLF